MSRLTNCQALLHECIGCAEKEDCYENSCGLIEKAIEKLAHYEDLEDDGKLLELPCKVGNRIYEVIDEYSRLNRGGCTGCTNEFGSAKNCEYLVEDERGIFGCENHTGNKHLQIISRGFSLEQYFNFGKTVFLSREEAEKALEEMREEV